MALPGVPYTADATTSDEKVLGDRRSRWRCTSLVIGGPSSLSRDRSSRPRTTTRTTSRSWDAPRRVKPRLMKLGKAARPEEAARTASCPRSAHRARRSRSTPRRTIRLKPPEKPDAGAPPPPAEGRSDITNGSSRRAIPSPKMRARKRPDVGVARGAATPAPRPIRARSRAGDAYAAQARRSSSATNAEQYPTDHFGQAKTPTSLCIGLRGAAQSTATW